MTAAAAQVPPVSPAPLLVLCHSGQRSGAEKVMLDVVAEARRRGHDVTVVCPDGPLVEALPAGVGHVEVPPLGLAGETGVRRALALARLARDWARAARVVRGLVRSRPRTRVVVNSLMATPVLRLGGLHGAWLVHDTVATGKQRAALRVAGPAIRGAVAVSTPTADTLAGTGIPVTVRTNGITLPAPDLVRDPADPPVVGILASLTPWKGHRLLLEAVAGLPGVEVEIAGTGFPGEQWYADELRARSALPDLAGRVRFLGHRPTYTALERWDVCVSCSELPEAGPLCVVEALAAGVAVVATTRAAYADPGSCVVVEPDDAAALAAGISRALGRSDEERRTAVWAGRAVVAGRHDLARTAAAQLDALLYAAGPARPGPGEEPT